nr:spaetzle-3 protein [Altica viridicyanea]
MMKQVIWLINSIINCYATCSHLYGAQPCTFLPAPPGKTPPCARPGYTYCEHPDQYPGQLINYLAKKWKYDHLTLFSSESQEEFSSYYYPSPSGPVYGPPNYHPPKITAPEPIYIPKPQYPFQENNINYIPQNFTGYPEGPARYNTPNHYTGRPIYYNQPYQQNLEPVPYGQYNNLWKRSLLNNYQRFKRSLRYKRMPKIYSEEKYSNHTNNIRTRRQTGTNQRQLCQVRTQYIVPRAALNNKGNWMYIVNMPEVDSKLHNLLKVKFVCNSQVCDGICNLPDGFSSRCEQRYVQKRLVALEAGGNQLYTDIFWFPSCCVCTISNS